MANEPIESPGADQALSLLALELSDMSCCVLIEKNSLKKPDKFLMGKPSQNYRVSPKYGVTQFNLQPNVSEHTSP